MDATYDTIGLNYAELRKPDPRIARRIADALGGAGSVLNVGAGTGSYEPDGCQITAVEPSSEMIRQRWPATAHVVQAGAEQLPFQDRSFDAAMAVLTIHHWKDKARGLREMRRVTRGPIVILTYDPAFRGFWLPDYIPELIALDEAQMPNLSEYQHWLGPAAVSPVPIPHDCTDGFLCAYWRRPAAYLDPCVRAAMSSFWALGPAPPALRNLKDDLDSGAWAKRYANLLEVDEMDCGYRLLVTGGS
jgi:SAM-dependent methyltransferase